MQAPPKPCSPKPCSTVGYLFLTTLWAFLLPGVVIHILPLLFIAGHGPGLGEIWFVLGLLAVCAVLFCLCVFLIIRFVKNHQAGGVPGSFALWILPFWIPLFWGLAATAVCLFLAPTLLPDYRGSLLVAFPQYFIPFALTIALGGDIAFSVITASIITFFCAIAGTIFVGCITMPVPRWRDVIVYSVLTLALWGVAVLAYNHFRTAVFPHQWNDDGIVRDERINPHGGDTDLSEYIPFAENNRLVKIESPTLVIASEHPRIHGAFALHPLYAAAVEATYRNTGNINFDHRNWNARTVRVGTSPEAFNALIDGTSDMLFMARPSERQLQEAADAGIELVITPIGYEAFVFFVSTVNPVDGLTLDQIRDIYARRITRWNLLGGRNERILPFQRPEGSGSQTAMQRVMGDVPMAPPLQEEFRRDMGGIVTDVADYRNYGNALGFSFRFYVEGLFRHDGVKLLNIDGIAPTIENIQNGTYPLIGEIVIISRADNRNPNVPRLTDWFLSPQGQELVRDVGYVPLGERSPESGVRR